MGFFPFTDLFGDLPHEVTLVLAAFEKDVVHCFDHFTLWAYTMIFIVHDFTPVYAAFMSVMYECNNVYQAWETHSSY